MSEPLVLFQEFPIADWPWGGTSGILGLFSSETWTDQNNLIHLVGDCNALLERNPLQQCPIVVSGRSATVQEFLVEPTIKSIDAPNVRITGVLFDELGNAVHVLFSGWYWPDLPNPMSWRQLTLANHTKPKRLSDRYGTWQMILNLFAQGQSSNGPTAVGLATLDGGIAVVLSSLVTADSLIQLTLQDDNSSGVPRPIAIVPGTGFTIATTNGGDSGVVAWSITEPF